MKKMEDLNYYELLEVSTDSTPQDIHRAYERIRKIYEPNSIALYSLFSPEETTALNQRIEDAYRTLVYEDTRRRYDHTLRRDQVLPETGPTAPLPERRQQRPQQPVLPLQQDDRYLKSAEPIPASVPHAAPVAAPIQLQPLPSSITEFTGSVLKDLREQRELTIRNIADITKLGTRSIEFLEEENFTKLPARAYIRGFLSLYAKALGYTPERLLTDYMKRYDAAMNPQKQK